jgi:hypothetical protein
MTKMAGTRGFDWRKAARSVNNGECVEVAGRSNDILVRDSTLRDGLVLSYPKVTWMAFLDSLRSS